MVKQFTASEQKKFAGWVLIAALSANQVIGQGGKMPWNYPEDLAWFKATTSGHIVLMGRTTWQSLGAPLPGRQNVVISSNPGFTAPGATVINTPQQAYNMYANKQVFVMGGASIYSLFLSKCHWLYLTKIGKIYQGDTYFPPVNYNEFKLKKSWQGNNPELTFEIWERF